MRLEQSFSNSALLTSWPDNSLLWGAVLYTKGHFAASWSSIHYMSVASATNCDNQKFFLILPMFPWKKKTTVPIENYWSRIFLISKLGKEIM